MLSKDNVLLIACPVFKAVETPQIFCMLFVIQMHKLH